MYLRGYAAAETSCRWEKPASLAPPWGASLKEARRPNLTALSNEEAHPDHLPWGSATALRQAMV